MRKLCIVLGIFLSCILGIALASTVTTKDGKNYIVTDDGGYSTTYTNQQIMGLWYTAYKKSTIDAITYQGDHETSIIWNGIEQMAVGAHQEWQSNQVNGT